MSSLRLARKASVSECSSSESCDSGFKDDLTLPQDESPIFKPDTISVNFGSIGVSVTNSITIKMSHVSTSAFKVYTMSNSLPMDVTCQELLFPLRFCHGESIYVTFTWTPSSVYHLNHTIKLVDQNGRHDLAFNLNGRSWQVDPKIWTPEMANEAAFKDEAATVIQKCFKRYLIRKSVAIKWSNMIKELKIRTRAAIVIQKFLRSQKVILKWKLVAQNLINITRETKLSRKRILAARKSFRRRIKRVKMSKIEEESSCENIPQAVQNDESSFLVPEIEKTQIVANPDSDYQDYFSDCDSDLVPQDAHIVNVTEKERDEEIEQDGEKEVLMTEFMSCPPYILSSCDLEEESVFDQDCDFKCDDNNNEDVRNEKDDVVDRECHVIDGKETKDEDWPIKDQDDEEEEADQDDDEQDGSQCDVSNQEIVSKSSSSVPKSQIKARRFPRPNSKWLIVIPVVITFLYLYKRNSDN